MKENIVYFLKMRETKPFNLGINVLANHLSKNSTKIVSKKTNN